MLASPTPTLFRPVYPSVYIHNPFFFKNYDIDPTSLFWLNFSILFLNEINYKILTKKQTSRGLRYFLCRIGTSFAARSDYSSRHLYFFFLFFVGTSKRAAKNFFRPLPACWPLIVP